MEHGVADDGMVFLGAENDTHGRAIVRTASLVVIKTHIHVHLANVFMRQFASLEIKENKALEQVIVKDEVDIKVLRAGRTGDYQSGHAPGWIPRAFPCRAVPGIPA